MPTAALRNRVGDLERTAAAAEAEGLIVVGATGSPRLRQRVKVDADGQRSRGHHPADCRVPLVRQRLRPGCGVIAGEHHSRSGERMFDGVETFGFEPVEVLHSPLTTHIRYRRSSWLSSNCPSTSESRIPHGTHQAVMIPG
jgi:hypothetical protein